MYRSQINRNMKIAVAFYADVAPGRYRLMLIFTVHLGCQAVNMQHTSSVHNIVLTGIIPHSRSNADVSVS